MKQGCVPSGSLTKAGDQRELISERVRIPVD